MFDSGDEVTPSVCNPFAVSAAERAARNRGLVRDRQGRLVEPDPAEEAAAVNFAEAPPGGAFAVALEAAAADPAALSDAELIDAIVGFERSSRWASGHRARLIADFARRRPGDEPEAVSCEYAASSSRWAPDELGLALRISRPHAARLLTEAHALTQVLPESLAAVCRGEIDAGQARVLAELAPLLPVNTLRAVQQRVLPRAGEQTWAQYRAAVRRAVLRADPDGANRRHARARTQRRVVVTPEEDGMSSLWAMLTATDAAAGWQMLTRLAHGLGRDDQRSLDERRADLMVDLITGRLLLAHAQPPGPSGTAETTTADLPAEPATASTESAASAGGAATADPEAADAGAADARAADLGSADAGGADAAVRPDGPDRPAASASAPRATPSGAGVGGKPLVQVVVGLDTLTGANNLPAELVGYGPIPADLAREAATAGVWKRLVTDPLSGALLDHGRTTYRPPAALADFIKARDVTCRFPTCQRRALDCDLDHLRAWTEGGATDEANMHGFCGQHHLLKEQPGWQVIAHSDGTLTWITPTGHRHTSRPHDYRDHLPDPPEPDPLEHEIPEADPPPPAGPSESADDPPF